MKLRIKGNSIRLRLTRSEVAQFSERGWVEEAIEFGAAESPRFIYALTRSAQIEAPSAAMENNRLTVTVPELQATEWAATEQISLRAAQPLGGDRVLQILIEKDFACLEERPGEDETDAFPHPLAGKTC